MREYSGMLSRLRAHVHALLLLIYGQYLESAFLFS